MAITYTVTDVTKSTLTVSYNTGDWARFSIKKGQTKADIEELIQGFGPAPSEDNPWDNVSDIPLKLNDSATINDKAEQNIIDNQLAEETRNAEAVDYKTQRKEQYPGILTQLEGLYKARKGDNTLLNQIDSIIDETKSSIPKSTPDTTYGAWSDAVKQGSIDDRAAPKLNIYSADNYTSKVFRTED